MSTSSKGRQLFRTFNTIQFQWRVIAAVLAFARAELLARPGDVQFL